jgi:ABC-type nitrate/sulfonate/bicarbonate transport system ATPase subunit
MPLQSWLALPSLGFRCSQVGRTFGSGQRSVAALEDASWRHDHEFVCIVGPSGCGKSTPSKPRGLIEPTRASVH